MAINKSTGNMYGFVSHTWNYIKGICSHQCHYCFMKKLLGDRMKPIHADEKELQTDLGEGNFIFVGSSTDDWADNIPSNWIADMLDYCDKFKNGYLFQSKNPKRFHEFVNHPVFKKAVFCTTIESNRHYKEMGDAPDVNERAYYMNQMHALGFETYVTAEPVMDFDVDEMFDLVMQCHPTQVNIGKNSNWKVKLTEPTPEKVLELARMLKDAGVKVIIKSNITKYLAQ